MNIIFIYAEKCKDCARMKEMLLKAQKELKKDVEIVSVNSEEEEAIVIAVENGIDDIPACIIGKTVMYGKDGFTYEKIRNAMLIS